MVDGVEREEIPSVGTVNCPCVYFDGGDGVECHCISSGAENTFSGWLEVNGAVGFLGYWSGVIVVEGYVLYIHRPS